MGEDIQGPAEQAPAGLRPGSRIAGYVLAEQVGAGGMAVVFRAHDERLDRQVALKVLAPAFAADDSFRQRFIRESRAAAAVDDPHIIPVFEAGESGGVLFIAMRYVRGGDVRSLLTRSGPLPPAQVAEIIAQVASALDAAHERGLVHRDVKPANMLLDSVAEADRPGHVYLSDFGLSKGALAASGLTAAGQFLGTLDYISPEQIEGKLVDGRADEYALACAAFELLTGDPPFRRDEAMAVMYAQLSHEPPAVSSLRPGIPAAADQVFARALAKAPGDRYATCRDFSRAMRDALGVRPYDSGESVNPAAAVQPAPSRPQPQGSGPARGPATTVAPGPASRPTDVRAPADDHVPAAAGRGGRPRWRSPAALIGALVLLALGGGGAYVALMPPAKSAAQPATYLSAPGCSTAAAAAKALSLPSATLKLAYGDPFGVQVAANGRYVFASTPAALSVLVLTAHHTLARQYPYYVTTPGESAKGIVLTGDGKDLALAAGNGINVQSVPAAEQGAGTANVADLTVPGGRAVTNAVQVALSPGDQFAFVTLQYSNELAVFNLHQALSAGESGAGVFVGKLALGLQPTGMAVSPDGRWLYVTSIARTHASGASEGLLSVLSLAKLETTPASALVSQVTAGCSPVRVIVSADGTMVWVTARQSDELLGFSAARLRSDPKKALTAAVPVGHTPTGEVLVAGGTRLIVADTGLTSGPAAAHNLAVVNVAAALAGKRALIGYIAGGLMPRDFALQAGGQYLYVSDAGAAQIQVINLRGLP